MVFQKPTYEELAQRVQELEKAESERNRAEQLLRESEEHLSSIFRSAPIGIGSVVNRKLKKVNFRLCEITGYDEGELIGQSSRILYPSIQDFEFVGREKYAQIRDHGTGTVETLWQRKDGTILEILLSSTPVDMQDQSKGVTFTALDITERKRVERFSRDVIAKNPMSIQILDKDGQTLEVNSSYKSLFGSVPPSSYSILRDPQLLQMGMGDLFDQLRDGEVVHFPDTYFNAHDSISEFPDIPAWIRTVGFPLNDSNGKPERFVLMHENINERKQAEEALQKSEETFRNIVQASPMGIHIYQLQKNDRLVFVGTNPAADKLLGVDNTRFIGMSLEEAFPPLLRTEAPYRYRRAAQHGESWYTEQIDYDHGKIAGTFEVHAFQMSLGKVAVLFNDISERKLAEKERERLQMELTQAQKMEAVGQLAGGVAHDFNNMLGVIIGYAELILMQAEPSQQFHAELVEIQKAARRSADLTRQLLTFARKQTVAPKVLDLNQTVEGMLNMLRRFIGENINLIWMPGTCLWPIKIDPSQIDQILANLCVNARDAIAGVGTITVATENTRFSDEDCATHAWSIHGEYVRIAVSDTGKGMDEETLAHIFEPFFTTKGVGEGTGLGLATVYGAVKQNHGYIDTVSELGKGTTFTIYIPRYMDKVLPSARTASRESISSGTETILLVEDEPMILSMTTNMLVRQGYHVLTTSSPQEAIRLAKEHAGSIDLLITDVIMPEMNGRDLAKQLFAISPNIKCLFMSGYTANVVEPHGVLGEGVHFIQKPFNMEDLATAIREAIES